MNLVRMIYVSHMTEACDLTELHNILAVSKKKNIEKEITGVLCYDPVFFMQCIEGPREAINELYATILRDGRHTNVMLLEYTEIHARSFPDWSMAFMAADSVDRQILERYSGKSRFNPYDLHAQQACSFLLEMVAHHREHIKT